ncbi:hypothetical protein BH10ACI2_BH10ACI2_12980 [soil metagenome]
MLKMYHKNPHSGNTADFWENSWDSIEFEEALKLCSNDPLTAIFDKYISDNALILEGGCGKGHWVAYFADKGYRIVGLDFAQRTLAELDANRPGLTLCAGNVNALPFADNTFDAYYSGGVVEHFEAGCESSLSEARRVIKDDGTLLLSVPYYSPLRQMLTPFRSDEWRVLKRPEEDAEKFNGELTYFQYVYRLPEFKKMLSEAGLDTIETLGYSVMWGLYDLKFLSTRAFAKLDSPVAAAPAGETVAGENPIKSYIKHLLVSEDTSTPVSRLTTSFMRKTCANMMMFVCRKR